MSGDPTWRTLALVAVAAASLGAGVAYLPASAAVGAALVLGAGVLSLLNVRATADSLSALLVSLPLLILPLLPYLTQWDPSAAYLRFLLAGAVAFSLVVGVSRLRPDPFDTLGLLILGFALYQVAVLLAGGLSTYAILRWTNWIMFIPVTFVLLSPPTERALTRTALLVGGLLVCGAALQIVGVLGGDVGGLRLGGSSVEPIVARRYTSFTGNPNDFGLLMLCVAVVLFALVQGGCEPRVRRGPLLLGTVIALAAVLASSSRGAVLAALPVAAFLIYTLSVRRTALLLGAGLVSLAIILAFVPPLERSVRANLDSIPTLIGSEDPSSSARLVNWTTRLETANVNAFFGGGYGGYAPGIDVADEGLGARGERQAVSRMLTVDNGLLKLWLEEGVVGVLLLAGIFIVALRRATKLAKEPQTRIRGLIAGSALLAIAFRGLSVDLFDISPWNYILWLAVGLAAGAGHQATARGEPGHRTRVI